MQSIFNEKSKAENEMEDSVRDLYTLKLKLPLGNPNLKLVHTNQFLFAELPNSAFELLNLADIAKVLSGEYSRYSGYQLNRWYIESATITNDKKEFTIELGLNPFATPTLKNRDNIASYRKAYNDAFTKNNNTTTTGKTTNNKTSNKNKVKSTAPKLKLKNVKGFNKKDQEYIKKVVTQALKKKNNPVKPVPIMFAIYNHYNANHYYAGYDCMPKMRAYGFEGCWKRKNHNCGDGASTLVAMFRCAGLTADIMHKYGHFYVRVKCDGKWWYCDQAGDTGKHNWRKPGKRGNNNNVYEGISSSASVVGFRYC